MPIRGKLYLAAVISAGVVLLLLTLPRLASPSWPILLACTALAAILAPLKLRLPGMQGTYAPSFLPILYGIAHLTLAETLIIGVVTALAGSLINTKKRAAAVQVLFNAANVTVCIGACFLTAGALHDVTGLEASAPVAGVLLAGLYFFLNTGLVSGVLWLLSGKSLSEAAGSWYLWSFPYYLAGAAAVTLTPVGAGVGHWEGFLVLIALLMLLHFFCGLAERQQRETLNEANKVVLPGPARAYLYSVLAAAFIVLLAAVITRGTPSDGLRTAAMLALTVLLSALKVRLPGVHGTMSLSFVALLAAVIELTLLEVVLLAAVGALVQSACFAAHRPKLVQSAFSMASLVIATASAFAAVRLTPAVAGGDFLIGKLLIAAVLLYGMNTLLVSAILCLVESQKLSSIWRKAHFWIFPYYLVGAAAAAILVSTSHTQGWIVSLLVIPTTVLVYVSYRAQVYGQVAREN